MQIIRAFIIIFLMSYSVVTKAGDKYITIDIDALDVNNKHVSSFDIVDRYGHIAIVKINSNSVEEVSHVMHESFHRCGGFISHDSLVDAQNEMMSLANREIAKSFLFDDYSLTESFLVKNLIQNVDDINIQKTIEKLSRFKNRYYQSKTGIESQRWLKKEWEKLIVGRSDAQVELYKHDGWPQESVILKVQGRSDDAIVVGGHGDSIAGFFGRERAKAPGADDNASGIATITEIARVLMESSYQPEKTLYFISYAAEEVGLLGSRDLAIKFKEDNINVVGVLQLDMTNFKGSDDYDIILVSDYTNEEQNKFIGQLIDTYLPELKWGFDQCGYACSDHASWHGQGFPASAPFEAKTRDMNRHIHTRRDTIDQSGGHAHHARKFARLGVAYVVELDR